MVEARTGSLTTLFASIGAVALTILAARGGLTVLRCQCRRKPSLQRKPDATETRKPVSSLRESRGAGAKTGIACLLVFAAAEGVGINVLFACSLLALAVPGNAMLDWTS